MKRCLTSARLTMLCDIVKPMGSPEENLDPSDETGGSWVWQQDPDSGAIIKRWFDNPETPAVDESANLATVVRDVSVEARGVLTSGIQGAGSTERFDEIYHNVDWVKATFPAKVNITKRDRVTNIRTRRNNQLVWKEEEISGYPPTVFDVMGVTPVFDPFSNLVEQSVLLQRSEVQRGA